MKITFTSNFMKKFKKPELIKNAEKKIAFGVLNSIRVKTPVKTGFLKRSESFSITDKDISWGASADYAQVQEDKQHFLRDGLKEQKQNIMDELEIAFKENIK